MLETTAWFNPVDAIQSITQMRNRAPVGSCTLTVRVCVPPCAPPCVPLSLSLSLSLSRSIGLSVALHCLDSRPQISVNRRPAYLVLVTRQNGSVSRTTNWVTADKWLCPPHVCNDSVDCLPHLALTPCRSNRRHFA